MKEEVGFSFLFFFLPHNFAFGVDTAACSVAVKGTYFFF